MAAKPRSRTDLYKRVVDGREIVLRDGVCDCGTILYTHNLTDNKFEFRAKERWEGRNKPVQRSQVIAQGGNAVPLTFTCPDCGQGHIVAHIKDDSVVEDAIAVSEAGV